MMGAKIYLFTIQNLNPTGDKPNLADNDKVTFEVGQGQKGPAAMNVRVEG